MFCVFVKLLHCRGTSCNFELCEFEVVNKARLYTQNWNSCKFRKLKLVTWQMIGCVSAFQKSLEEGKGKKNRKILDSFFIKRLSEESDRYQAGK